MVDYDDYLGLNGNDNMGGLKSILYFIPYNDLDVIKEFISPIVNPEDAVTIDGAHTALTGKGFYKLYTTLDTAEIIAKITGERDSHGLEQVLTGYVPGCSPVLAAIIRNAKNDTFMVIAEDINSTTGTPIRYQLGIKGLPCEISSDFTTGTLSKGKKGFNISITAFANSMAYYPAAIPLHP